ncbi:MAG: hypothetical protein V2A79_01665 [Planctomycetota bacterium]
MLRAIQRRFLTVGLFSLWCGAHALAEDGQQLLQILRDADREFFGAVSLSMTITQPVGVTRDLGVGMWEGTLVASGERQGLILRGVHFDPPAYKPLGSGNYQEIDYDPEGNLILWRRQDAFALKTEDSNNAYEKWTCVHLAPNGVIVDQSNSSKLARLAVSDQKGLAVGKYRRIVRATGRGFAQYLTTISRVESLPSGLIVLEGTGQPWGRLKLTVDPEAKYLVRSAEFLGNKDEPSEVVSTTGTLTEDGLTIPLKGTVTLLDRGGAHQYRTIVEFDSASRTDCAEMIQHIKAQLSEDSLPVGTYIEDYRADPTSGRPVRPRVGENNGETK